MLVLLLLMAAAGIENIFRLEATSNSPNLSGGHIFDAPRPFSMPWGAKEIVEGTSWGRGNSAEFFGIHLATSASAASAPGDKRARRVLHALFVLATVHVVRQLRFGMQFVLRN